MSDIIVQFQRVLEHYEVHVNGQFEQSCDVGERTEVEQQIRNKYGKGVAICV